MHDFTSLCTITLLFIFKHFKTKFMSLTNFDLDLGAYQLGQTSAQSFLLAGERFVVSGMNRSETDEAVFQEFFENLNGAEQKTLRGYFEKQANLSLPQRVKVLGEFTDLKIEDKLTLSVASDLVARKSASVNSLNLMYSNIFKAFKKKKNKSERKTQKKYKRLSLNIHSLEVQRAQDRERWWSKKKVRLTDETALAVTVIDENGDVLTAEHNLGRIWEKNTKNFGKKALINIPLMDTSPNFPYYFQVIAIERDSNKQWNAWVDKIAKVAKKKVTEELIAAGLISVGAAFKVKIPPLIAKAVASFVKGFIDKLIDWVANLILDKDDIVGIEGFAYRLSASKRNSTGIFTKRFIEHKGKGRWKVRFSIDRK